MQSSPSLFLNGAARIQALAQGVLFQGVVDQITDTHVKIKCTLRHEISPGDKFFIELHRKGRAMFMAHLIHVGEPVVDRTKGRGGEVQRLLSFKMSSQIAYYDGRTRARSLRALSVSLDLDGRNLHAATTDVSERGIGVLLSEQLPAGQALTVRIDTRSGFICCAGTVRYCRKDPGFRDYYRVGVELAALSAEDTARIIGKAA